MTKWNSVLAIAILCAGCGGGGERAADGAGGNAPGAAGFTAGSGAPASVVVEPAGAAAATVQAKSAVAVPQYREVVLPEGTALRLELRSAVASDTSNVEDTVRAELRQPVAIDGREVVPAGAEVTGHVTSVERAGRVKGRARVAYQFSSLRVAGDTVDIRTAPVSHLAPATKRKDATKIAIGAGAGAAIGALLGGGDGALKGAAIGGAGGTGAVLATRGQEVRLGAGADVTTRLTAPVTLRVRVS